MFLAPIAGILVADYWLVKKGHYDIPALYDPFGRYRYAGLVPGFNWRAFVAFVVPVAPLLPGLALSIVTGGAVGEPSPEVASDAGIRNLYTFNWLFGFTVSIFLYTVLSLAVPDKSVLLKDTIWHLDGVEGEGPAIEGQTTQSDEEHGRARGTKTGGDVAGEKRFHESDAKPL